MKHSLLRAISGGPVYFSDKIGTTEPEVIKPLTYLDGRILMMDRSAKPTSDCLFTDPMKSGVLKLTNVAAHGQEYRGGGLAVYNLTAKRQRYTFSPRDVLDLDFSDKYWLYDYFGEVVKICDRDEIVTKEIEENQFAWYQMLVCNGSGTFIGLKEKYAGFMAVESMNITENGMIAVLHEQGIISFLSVKEPIKVLCNGVDMSRKVEQKGLLYTVNMEERFNKTVVEVVWN